MLIFIHHSINKRRKKTTTTKQTNMKTLYSYSIYLGLPKLLLAPLSSLYSFSYDYLWLVTYVSMILSLVCLTFFYFYILYHTEHSTISSRVTTRIFFFFTKRRSDAPINNASNSTPSISRLIVLYVKYIPPPPTKCNIFFFCHDALVPTPCMMHWRGTDVIALCTSPTQQSSPPFSFSPCIMS